MQIPFQTLQAGFKPGTTREATFDRMLDILRGLGFTSVIYDYSPVPLSHDGRLITPSVLMTRNVPDDMPDLWCRGGYYQIDPVQQVALSTSAPFLWSYLGARSEFAARAIGPDHAPVVRYLLDAGMTCGVTVPIHMRHGDLATFTGIRLAAEPDFEAHAQTLLPDFAMVGQMFHDAVFPGFGDGQRLCTHIPLTRRERECLAHCARGLTVKEIAHRLGRSTATVTLHMNSAIRKLGARNRVQAIARAAHYRLLDGAC